MGAAPTAKVSYKLLAAKSSLTTIYFYSLGFHFCLRNVKHMSHLCSFLNHPHVRAPPTAEVSNTLLAAWKELSHHYILLQSRVPLLFEECKTHEPSLLFPEPSTCEGSPDS